MIWSSGLDGLCDYFNQAWLTYTGRALEEELGLGWTQGLHPEDRQRVVREYSEGLESRRPFVLQYRLRRADGSYGWILVHGLPRFDPQGAVHGFLGSCLDISGRRDLEQFLRLGEVVKSLRLSESRVRTLIDALPQAALLVDLQGTILAINKVGAARFNLTPGDMEGRFGGQFLTPELTAARLARLKEVVTTGRPLRFSDQRGSLVLENTLWPVLDQQGAVCAVAVFSEDITERVKAGQAALESEEK